MNPDSLFLYFAGFIFVVSLPINLYSILKFIFKQHEIYLKEVVRPRKYIEYLKKKPISQYEINEGLEFLIYREVFLEDFERNYRSMYGFLEPSGSFPKDADFRLYLYSSPGEKERHLIGLDDSGRYCGVAKDFNFCIDFLLFQFNKTDTFLTITDIISNKKIQCSGIIANSDLLFSYFSKNGNIFLFLENKRAGIYVLCLKCSIAYRHSDFVVKCWDSINNPSEVEQFISEILLEELAIRDPLGNIVSTLKYFDKFTEEIYRNRKYWEWDESWNKPIRSERKFYSMDRICRFYIKNNK